eukprot:jgi/Galph1/5604/GphlegSOOS_G4286.1
MQSLSSPLAFENLKTLRQRYRTFLDKLTPFILYRWLAFGGLLVLFLTRIFLAKGFYIVAYVLFIYLLNLFILFLQPQLIRLPLKSQVVTVPFWKDRSALSSTSSEGPSLPVSSSDEFRPFVRRLPEFKFWLSGTRATILSILATAFSALDIPVFWPILVIYFIMLFIATMRRQIADMIQYRYLPFNIGKKKYSGSSKIVARGQGTQDNDSIALKSAANVKRATPLPSAQNYRHAPMDVLNEPSSPVTNQTPTQVSSRAVSPNPLTADSRQLHRFHRG